MEFNKAKVFTALNANEVKVGSKGYGSDTIEDLKNKVITGGKLLELAEIRGENSILRFIDTLHQSYALFYFVKEPEKEKYRPYNNTAEIPGGALLNIVVSGDNTRLLITAVEDKRVYLGPHGWVDLYDLYKYYTRPNGAPCGVEWRTKNDREIVPKSIF